MISLLLGIFFGTFFLAWSYHYVHKYGWFDISIIWKYHKLHHRLNDPEFKLKSSNLTIIEYGFYSSLKYFDPYGWTKLDWLVYIIGCLFPTLGLAWLIGIFISENIGYLQHTADNSPVDFTNRFDNWWGLNMGDHAAHHNKISKYATDTEVIYGLLCMYTWAIITILTYPLLLIVDARKSNLPGIYCFGLIQNLRNYKAANGVNIRKLLYRMPSIFDKPVILCQYIKLLFNTTPLQTEYAHDISDIRNIYNFKEIECVASDYVYKGCRYDGHHRNKVKCKGGFYEYD